MADAISRDEIYLEELRRGLTLSCGPGSTREAFVRGSSETLARLHALKKAGAPSLAESYTYGGGSEPAVGGTQGGTVGEPTGDAGTAKAAKEGTATSSTASSASSASSRARGAVLSAPVEALVELRAADSLLRLLRDKLLLSAKILEQEQSDCYARVRRRASHRRPGYAKAAGKSPGALLSRARRAATSPRDAVVVRERTRLQMTSALLERQLERLGAVQKLLLTRPTPLSASVLVDPHGASESSEEAAELRVGEER